MPNLKKVGYPPDLNSLSVVILAKNEEESIDKAIKSVKSLSFEIFVIDDNSTGQTTKIAKKLGAIVYKNELVDFASQRNFGLKKATGDWVLFLDADEVISGKLAKEITDAAKSNRFNGYYISRRDYFLNKQIKFGEAGNIKLLRLGRKSAGKWVRGVHETWDIKENVGSLKNPIYHYPHKNLIEFINSVNIFSSLHAKENIKEGKKSSTIKIIIWPVGKFLQNYIFKLGFVDGIRGLIYATMMSLHSFLAWSKQWIEENK